MTVWLQRRVSLARLSVVAFVLVAVVATVFMVRMGQGQAMPGSATDQTAVPHYFGPWPNWVLSPQTLPDATVTINGAHDTAASAVASVGGNGAVTGITVTAPGSGYTAGAVTVDISGAGSGATADASVTVSSAVSSVAVTAPGHSYTKPAVVFSGGGATTQATGTAYGSVDAVAVSAGGSGYTFPTVDFDMPDDPNGVQATAHATMDGSGTITAVVVDNPGSGYAAAPGVVIRDGTLMDPITHTGTDAAAAATIRIDRVGLDTLGAGYTAAPSVAINETAVGGAGTGAAATAKVAAGTISSITVLTPGTGYVTAGGIKKFQDALPGLCDPAGAGCPTTANAKFIPLAVPTSHVYNGINADEYDIAVVQYRTSFSSSLPDTLVRGYVQVETADFVAKHPGVSQHVRLMTYFTDRTRAPEPVLEGGQQVYGVTSPQWLGPTIVATKDKPVRIRFHNLLPKGVDGNLFLPVDTTIMGSGMGPMDMAAPTDNGTVLDEVRNPVCTDNPQDPGCFKQNRATLHLHGGTTPWISDGTPHQWITPANEDTAWPQGVSVTDVPDMTPRDVPNDGIQTFYYTNQQSARLMFYHDHAWGITRLNVYAGEAAGYLISDNTEKSLVQSGVIPGAAATIPLVVQDRTFVPQDSAMYDTKDTSGTVIGYGEDPTWSKTKWGDYGSLWYHHVYMPAQNPGDPSGMSAYGRWMYGPWFWPPAASTPYGPIDNPYYVATCNIDDPTTWQYDTMPYCEPKQIPGTPNVSAGMEQFNDTPIVNGVAYPRITVDPKAYRFRMLNAANDRFFNFQWYVADPRTGTLSEVALKQSELNAAQTDPAGVYPTPDTAISAAGPDWIAIASEGGFLPAPAVISGSQPITWITDPTRFDFGNVDQHSLVLAPAERADVIVDFSQYAGQTLILYNDAPAAYPARVPSYDYYTGQPDMSPNGAAAVLPGYGPNTRTIMQVTVSAGAGTPFNLQALRNAFSHKANGTGVFESGQHPIIVGQAAYNSAYGTNFAASSNCNAPNSTLNICDGLVRVSDTSTFGFNTLKNQTTKSTMPLQPKAIHDEMNATTFDEYGRMQANLGVEAQPPTPGLQNVTLYPYVNPSTELIDGTSLPRQTITYDVNGDPVSDVKITPVATATDGTITDGTQIWRITHNGVDTHPIHFHFYDVQLVNRVTWDNIIIAPEANELGWKDTVRVSPLEDTIVALRPVVPDLPWELPNSVRNLNPMMPAGSTAAFNNIDPQGNPTASVVNQLVNFGWEYVYHCHILSHEEMDMMRPVSVVLPPNKATGVVFDKPTATLSWTDNSINETSFLVQRSTDGGTTWTEVGTSASPLNAANTHGTRSLVDTAYDAFTDYQYRVVARNTAGYGAEFPTVTAQSTSATVTVLNPPKAPTGLTAVLAYGPQVTLTWLDNATNETGYAVERAAGAGAFTPLTTLGAVAGTGSTVTYVDLTAQPGTTYTYRVRAVNTVGNSAYATSAPVVIPARPAAPTNLAAALQAGPQVNLTWRDNANNETGFIVERSTDGVTFTLLTTAPAKNGTGNVTYLDTTVLPGTTYWYRVAARNAFVNSLYSNTVQVAVPALPGQPTINTLTAARQGGNERVTATWTNVTGETGYTIQWSTTSLFTTVSGSGTVGANVTTFQTGSIARQVWWFRVGATNQAGTVWSAPVSVNPAP
jgi:FtsP/CotA-like multicopper oxidase with cupredoxin domain